MVSPLVAIILVFWFACGVVCDVSVALYTQKTGKPYRVEYLIFSYAFGPFLLFIYLPIFFVVLKLRAKKSRR